MAFSEYAITTAGRSLIAAATAADPIVIVGFMASQTAKTTAQIESSTLSDYDIIGDVFSCSSFGTLAVLRGKFINVASEVYAKTFVAIARRQSQTDADSVVLAGISDATANIRIPPITEPPVSIYIPINITLAASGTIQVVSGSAAVPSDLERFVSMFSAGNPTQGENQTIRGSKTFKSTCLFEQQITAQQVYTQGAYIDGGVTIKGGVYMNDNAALLSIYLNKLEIDSDIPKIASTASGALLDFANGEGRFGKLKVSSGGYASSPLIETGTTNGGFVNVSGYSMEFGDSDAPFEEVNVHAGMVNINSPCSVAGNEQLSVSGLLDLSVGNNVNGELFFDVQPYNYGKIFCGGDITIQPSTGDVSAKTLNGLLETLYSDDVVGAMYKVKVLKGAGVSVIARGTIMQNDMTNFTINYQYGNSYLSAPYGWKFAALEYNIGDGVTEFWAIRIE